MPQNNASCFRTSIGGQALIEGILMRGPRQQAIVCRTKDGLVEKVEDVSLIRDKYPILRLPLLREGREQVRFTTRSTKTPDEWQHWEFAILPCIATKLELRMTRVADELAPQGEYSLGVRKLAIRRAVTTREQAALGLHDSVDALGNVVSKAVRDWQPEKAVDGSDETFWKCEPQVSQDAVVCLYLDVSDDEGQARFVHQARFPEQFDVDVHAQHIAVPGQAIDAAVFIGQHFHIGGAELIQHPVGLQRVGHIAHQMLADQQLGIGEGGLEDAGRGAALGHGHVVA